MQVYRIRYCSLYEYSYRYMQRATLKIQGRSPSWSTFWPANDTNQGPQRPLSSSVPIPITSSSFPPLVTPLRPGTRALQYTNSRQQVQCIVDQTIPIVIKLYRAIVNASGLAPAHQRIQTSYLGAVVVSSQSPSGPIR